MYLCTGKTMPLGSFTRDPYSLHIAVLKAEILYLPVGEWLQYEKISRWSLTTV